VKKPRISPSLEGQTSGMRELPSPVRKNGIGAREGPAAHAKESASSRQAAAAALATPKQEKDEMEANTVQLALQKVKAEPAKDSRIKAEPPNDVDERVLLKDESGNQGFYRSIARLRLPASLHGRALKDEGDLADSKLRIDA